MTAKVSMNESLGRINIESEMTIYTAQEIKNQLCSMTLEMNDIEIDLSRVTEIDTAGIQILILIKREAVKKNRNLRLMAHSQAVIEVIDACNLASYFGDPLVLPTGQ